jgi:hypothetical protein
MRASLGIRYRSPDPTARGIPRCLCDSSRHRERPAQWPSPNDQAGTEPALVSVMPCPDSDSLRRSFDGNSTVIPRYGST